MKVFSLIEKDGQDVITHISYPDINVFLDKLQDIKLSNHILAYEELTVKDGMSQYKTIIEIDLTKR